MDGQWPRSVPTSPPPPRASMGSPSRVRMILSDGRFYAPYVTSSWQETSLDGFDYSAVIGTNVNVRSG